MAMMLDCKEVLAKLSEYIDGEGSDELRKAIALHLSRCSRCRVVFDTTGRMLKIVTDVEPFEVPLGVSARLYARLERFYPRSEGLRLQRKEVKQKHSLRPSAQLMGSGASGASLHHSKTKGGQIDEKTRNFCGCFHDVPRCGV